MSQRLDDIYFTRDFPVLAVIGKWEGEGRTDGFLRPETTAEGLKRPLDQVMQSVGRLYHAGLVDAADATTFGGEDYIIRRLTGAGLQESGPGLNQAISRRLSKKCSSARFKQPLVPTRSGARSFKFCSTRCPI